MGLGEVSRTRLDSVVRPSGGVHSLLFLADAGGIWRRFRGEYRVPYYPNVSMGWDPSPRCDQRDKFDSSGYPFTNTIGGNTPERFREALEMTKQRLLAMPNGPRILNINCWNEWTEGSYLEPDQAHGMKYLEAVREVFGTKEAR